MNLNIRALNFFNRIYLINLDIRKNRLKRCQQEFEKFSFGPVTRISAIKNDNGTVGRLLTEKLIIEECIKDNLDNVLILEDDIVFQENFYEVLSKAILELPKDWMLFYLGFTPGDLGSISIYSENLIKLNVAWGCFALCYSKLAISKIDEYFSSINFENPELSIDGFCGKHLVPDFNCFSTNPPIVLVNNDASDISKDSYRQSMGSYCKIKYNLLASSHGTKKIKE